jgi:hypothetical protein
MDRVTALAKRLRAESTPSQDKETEQDGIREEALRRSKVRRLSKGQAAQTRASSPLPKDTPSQSE